MRVGISVRSAYSVDDVRRGARFMVERTAAARDAGLDSLFVGDHHNVPVPYYQNSPILGRLLAEWDERPAGALYLLPLWHPLIVAEHVATLSAVAGGPFVLQCAIGAGTEQFAALGTSERDRATRFEESLSIVRRLLAGEEVDATDPWSIQSARIAPLPPEPVAIWIGGHAPRAIDRAARLGDAWLAGPDLVPDAVEHLLDIYRQRCDVHGRKPSVIAIRRDVHVGADDADARSVAGPVLDAGYRGFDPSACVVGGVDTVADEFRCFASMGYTDVIVRNIVEEQRSALASIQRLADVRRLVVDA